MPGSIMLLALVVMATKRHKDNEGAADLVVDAHVLRTSLSLDRIRVDDPCLVGEGCLLAAPVSSASSDAAHDYTHRVLVRFSTRVWNVGQHDLHVGTPPSPEGSGGVLPPGAPEPPPYWEYSGCHDHWHLSGYARHELLYADTLELVSSEQAMKSGFCMRDNVCDVQGERRGGPYYTCNNQGVSAGCADHYGSELACQWIDVTSVYYDEVHRAARTRFVVRIAINVNHFLNETNYTNNDALSHSFDLHSLPAYESPTSVYVSLAVVALLAIVGTCASLVWL